MYSLSRMKVGGSCVISDGPGEAPRGDNRLDNDCPQKAESPSLPNHQAPVELNASTGITFSIRPRNQTARQKKQNSTRARARKMKK